jgi:hypothetical protein
VPSVVKQFSRFSPLLEFVELRQDFLTMPVGIHVGINLGDLSRRIDQEGVSRSDFDNH